MKIAAHLKQDRYKPSCLWPDSCMVQWGSSGIVLDSKESYRTAFFEAFPPHGFIRGEGATIALAEQQAFAQFQKEAKCDHHWGRNGYTNGGALCRKCKSFSTKIFKPIHEFGLWRKSLDATEISYLEMESPFPEGSKEYNDGQKLRHKLRLRQKIFGTYKDICH